MHAILNMIHLNLQKEEIRVSLWFTLFLLLVPLAVCGKFIFQLKEENFIALIIVC